MERLYNGSVSVIFVMTGFLFHPDYVVETLLSYLRQNGVKKAKALQYFLDDQYRENPKDYSPTEIVYQIILDP